MFRQHGRPARVKRELRGARWMLVITLTACAGCSGVSNRLHARLDLKKGNESYLAGDYHAAIQHYDRAVAHVPTLAPAWLNRAYSQEALFRASQTLEERQALADSAATTFQKYRQLVEAGHDPGGARLERVEEHLLTLYLDSQQPDKAVGVLEERLKSHPNDMASLQMLANLSMDLGDLDSALKWHRKRIELEPDKAEGYVALAVMCWHFSNKNIVPEDQRGALLDEGTQAAEKALELKPDYYEALIYANLLYREKEKYATSAADKAEFAKKYTDYQERARQVQAQPKSADSTGVKHGG
jgi:tetratricopeptide (TPR) repeat protein